MYGTSSTLTGTIDNIFLFFLAVSVFFLVLITGLMIYFAVKYRRSKHPEAVQIEVARQLENLSRANIAAASLEGQGGAIITPDLETAIRLADDFAPEHLCLSTREPEKWAEKIRNAGGIFLGEHSFEVLGDYVAGPSHIMPTGGTARFKGPVNVLDFVKVINIIGLDGETAAGLCPTAKRIADAESLTAHGAAAGQRISSN